jgi:hypothetical protein
MNYAAVTTIVGAIALYVASALYLYSIAHYGSMEEDADKLRSLPWADSHPIIGSTPKRLTWIEYFLILTPALNTVILIVIQVITFISKRR